MKHILSRTLFTTLFLYLTCSLIAQIPNDDRVLLQGFHWQSANAAPEGWYNRINAQATEMGQVGFDMIWMPPPSNAGSLEGYLPRELNNLNNNYGNVTEHAAMITALHANGIEVIADIVVNHRVGCTNWLDFCNPTWGGTSAITGNDEVWSQAQYSNIFPRGNWDTGTSYGPARDVDHTNPVVQQGIIDWMNQVLKGIGYDGWRYDFVHGFAPQYISLYNNNTNPTFSVGEYWTQDKQVIQNWIDATGSSAFDFPTYYALKGAIRDNNWSYLAFNGQASGGIGWDPRNYTTFIENHDTPDYDPSNNVLNGNNVGTAYAYLLTHPGVPTVFYPHFFDWGVAVKQELSRLIAVRKDAGIHSQSGLNIVASNNGLYAALVQGTEHQIAVKLGYASWDPTSAGLAGNWVLETSGNDYAIWKNVPPTFTLCADATTTTAITVYSDQYTHAYAWDDQQNAVLGAWPGTALSAPVNGWRSISLPNGCSNIIFSNNGAQQTANLYTCGGYFRNNDWVCENPNTISADVLSTASLNPSSYATAIRPTIIKNHQIQLWAETPAAMTAQIQVVNLAGQAVLNQAIELTTGSQQVTLTLPTDLSAGIYLVHCQLGDFSQYHKVVMP